MSDDLIGLVDTLDKSVCGSAPVSFHVCVCVCVCVFVQWPILKGFRYIYQWSFNCAFAVFVCLCRRSSHMGTWFWLLSYFCGIK